eukprot:Skav206409  [mRNA]  locus=scaffold2210:249795:252626:- [translate_table: standard]
MSLASTTLDSGGPTPRVDTEIFTHMKTSRRVFVVKLCVLPSLETPVVGRATTAKVLRVSCAEDNEAVAQCNVKEMPAAASEQMIRVRPQGSQFDLCTWATGMGFVDVCVASIVVLPRRADATQFVSLWAEPTYLVGPVVEQRSQESQTLGYMLSAAFRPFSTDLWLAMLGVYRAFFSLCMCESRFEPTTLGGRIVGLGLAFLLYLGSTEKNDYIENARSHETEKVHAAPAAQEVHSLRILLVCGYTATLASFLVVEKKVAPVIDSLDGAIRKNFKICSHISHRQTLLAGGVDDENILVIQSRAEVLDSIGTLCDVGVMSSEDFEAAQATNRGSYCNLERIGLPLGSIMVGMPVSDRWVKQLRYAITSMSSDGLLQQSLTQYRPQAYCDALDSDTNTDPTALTLAAWRLQF